MTEQSLQTSIVDGSALIDQGVMSPQPERLLAGRYTGVRAVLLTRDPCATCGQGPVTRLLPWVLTIGLDVSI